MVNWLKPGIYYAEKELSNHQIAYIEFCRTDVFSSPLDKPDDWYVSFCIADKKKQIRRWLYGEANSLVDKATGTCGLEGLVFARDALLEFEEILSKEGGGRIIIQGSDNRRFRLYKRYLSKYHEYKEAFHPKEKRFLYKKVFAVRQ